MHGEFITTIRSDQPFTVDEIERLGRFVLGKATMNKIIFQHGSNAHTSTSSSEEDKTMFMGFYSWTANCIDETTQNDRCCSLNLLLVLEYLEEYIIIETGLFVSPIIEKFESEFSVEIFELD